jgi:uncharacterized protein (DUF488 family)
MTIYTIGFQGKTAQEFFEALKTAGIKRLIDIRLRNDSHLAGFARRVHLEYLLREVAGIEYVYEPFLAPTDEILDAWRAKSLPWDEYEKRFGALLKKRKIEEAIDRKLFDVPVALLCSEPKANRCHRRLVAEYLAGKWGAVKVRHL